MNQVKPSVVLRLVLFALFSKIRNVECNLKCMSCDRVGDMKACATSVTCGENQVCFTEKHVSDQRQVLYSGGCRESSACPDHTIVIPVGKRRRNNSPIAQLACSKCCYGSHNCNLKLCGDAIINGPPKIVTQSTEDVLYIRIGQSFTIPCRAEGSPLPVYIWKLNGMLFSPSGKDGSIVQKHNEGTLQFLRYTEKEEGTYQCLAQNGYGISVSRVVKIITAKFLPYPLEAPMVNTAIVGTSATLSCTIPKSIPFANVKWVLSNGNGTWQDLVPNPRIIMDMEGRLRFLNVRPEDEVSGMSYRCLSSNSVTGDHHLGSVSELRVVGGERRVPVTEIWSSPADQFFIKTNTLKLMCLFGGNPTPNVYWTKSDGSHIDNNRTTYTNFGTTLQIRDVDYSDAGKYKCIGTNSETAIARMKGFDIRIRAAPYWKVKPVDATVAVNGSATFICKAEGDPTPINAWFINGTPLHESKDPRVQGERVLQPTNYNFTLTRLTVGDQMNIQCNSSNVLGYLFADVILKVDP